MSDIRPDTQGQESAERMKTRPFPAAMYRAFIGFLLIFAAKGGDELYSGGKSLDDRPMNEKVRSYLTWRSKMSKEMKENIGEVTETRVERDAKATQCTLELFNFVPTKEPTNPKLLTLWKENNETRGDHVYVAGLSPKDTYTPHILAPENDEQIKGGARFDFHQNTGNYLLRLRRKGYEQKYYELMQDKYFQYQYGWLKQGFEEYKKDHPLPTDLKEAKVKDAKEWTARLWTDYIGKAYLDQPPTPAYDCNGQPALTKDNMPCLFVKPLADGYTRATRRMCEAGKKGIQYDTCGRSNDYQTAIFAMGNGHGCSLEGAKEGLSAPGTSTHEAYLGADISNWTEAEFYLILEAGVFCNLDEDKGHCSPVEEIPSGISLKKEMADAYLTVFGKEAWEKIKIVWDAM